MTIETKYNIGDEVWVEFFMRPTRMVVESIQFIKDENTENIWYFVVNNIDRRECYDANESELFPTKEELLESL
ncbi:MAG: hypothetical protein J6U49_06630 [Alistipes sp.]|nr:hypothetical protein [Alistipes sp.]